MARRGGRGYGKRGGTGPTAGRKAETLIDPISGTKLRVFFGQRWLSVVQQNETAPMFVSAWHTKAEAEQQTARIAQSMERELTDWQQHDKERHIWRGLPAEPPHGRPDVEYIIEGKVSSPPRL